MSDYEPSDDAVVDYVVHSGSLLFRMIPAASFASVQRSKRVSTKKTRSTPQTAGTATVTSSPVFHTMRPENAETEARYGRSRHMTAAAAAAVIVLASAHCQRG
jgi:hypothetical protein